MSITTAARTTVTVIGATVTTVRDGVPLEWACQVFTPERVDGSPEEAAQEFAKLVRADLGFDTYG